MLVSIKILDEDKRIYNIRVNVMEISIIDFQNPRNIDEGTRILMRSNTEIFTPEPLDIIDKRVTEVFERYRDLVLVSAVSEAAKRVAKKPTRKKG